MNLKLAFYLFSCIIISNFYSQADIRIPHTCDEDAKNVIINLKNHQGALAEGKCLTVNPVRTEMIAVGSNDPYIRLYDRRMIKVTTNRVRHPYSFNYSIRIEFYTWFFAEIWSMVSENR